MGTYGSQTPSITDNTGHNLLNVCTDNGGLYAWWSKIKVRVLPGPPTIQLLSLYIFRKYPLGMPSACQNGSKTPIFHWLRTLVQEIFTLCQLYVSVHAKNIADVRLGLVLFIISRIIFFICNRHEFSYAANRKADNVHL